MSRSERLLDLIQALRRHRRPVTGSALASELGVSIRTLYRDIATLQGQGADIQGEPGLGYVLKPGFMLPPLMFSEDEIEAITLGVAWVSRRADARLGKAAGNAAAKIGAVLPEDLRREMETSSLMIGPGQPVFGGDIDLSAVRDAIRRERKLRIEYRDRDDVPTLRTVWPFLLAFFDRMRMIVAWCELRQGYRHFRADRIVSMQVLEARAGRRRLAMAKEWRIEEGFRKHVDPTAKN